MTNSNFLKKLLATASVVAVSASASSALANFARVTKGNANQAGVNLEQSKVGGAFDVAVGANSTITFRGAHTYTDAAGAAVNLAGIKVDGNFVATIDSTAAGNNYTLGSIIRAAGSTGVVNINLNNVEN